MNSSLPSSLQGKGLLMSEGEWTTRNETLASTLGQLVSEHVQRRTGRALDIGCQTGAITDLWAKGSQLEWYGIDPKIPSETTSPEGHRLLPGWANALPFPDAHFDCTMLANVYEHIPPTLYDASIEEMRRVLVPGGILVGQLPNPYFPIESHSRLPFMGWLPYRLQKAYWRFTPVPWEHDFFVVTIRDLRQRANRLGFETVLVQNFNYPLDVIPKSVRPVAHLLQVPMRYFPWSWQFVFRAV